MMMEFILRKVVLGTVVVLWAFYSTTFAQRSLEFKDRHGKTVHAIINPKTKTVESIHGFSENIQNYGLSLDKLNKESVNSMARKLIDDYSLITKISSREIKEQQISRGGRLWIAEYHQAVNGIPVDGSQIGLAISAISGDIIAFKLVTYPDVNITTRPSISSSDAVNIVKEDFPGEVQEGPELVILPEEQDSSFTYHLAWKMVVGGATTLRYFVDALDGKILRVMGNKLEGFKRSMDTIIFSIKVTRLTKFHFRSANTMLRYICTLVG